MYPEAALGSGSHNPVRHCHCSDAACGLLQVKLQGIPGIRKVFMRELKTTHLDQEGIYQTENQWVLDTEGVNLLDVSWLARLASTPLATCFLLLDQTCIPYCGNAQHRDDERLAKKLLHRSNSELAVSSDGMCFSHQHS